MNTLSITPVKFTVTAKFPSFNKNDDWSDYESQIDSTVTEKVEVQEIITLTDSDFQEFKVSLLENRSWLDGKGGTDSTFNTDHVENFWELSSEEQEKFKQGAYRCVLLVQNTQGENILVDPQGYKYARYCGVIS